MFLQSDPPGENGNTGGERYPGNERQKTKSVVHSHRECRTSDAYSLEQQFKRAMIFLPLIMLVEFFATPKRVGSKMREIHPPRGERSGKIGTPGRLSTGRGI